MKRITQSNYSGVLPYLLHHCQTLLHLNQILATTLSTSLQQHCYIANLRAGIVVIHVDSALWATRLRYEIPTHLKQWQTLLSSPTLEKIEIRVRPPLSTIKSPVLYPKPTLSKQTATSLCEVANTVSHAKLKAALLKLATHVDCNQVD